MPRCSGQALLAQFGFPYEADRQLIADTYPWLANFTQPGCPPLGQLTADSSAAAGGDTRAAQLQQSAAGGGGQSVALQRQAGLGASAAGGSAQARQKD